MEREEKIVKQASKSEYEMTSQLESRVSLVTENSGTPDVTDFYANTHANTARDTST